MDKCKCVFHWMIEWICVCKLFTAQLFLLLSVSCWHTETYDTGEMISLKTTTLDSSTLPNWIVSRIGLDAPVLTTSGVTPSLPLTSSCVSLSTSSSLSPNTSTNGIFASNEAPFSLYKPDNRWSDKTQSGVVKETNCFKHTPTMDSNITALMNNTSSTGLYTDCMRFETNHLVHSTPNTLKHPSNSRSDRTTVSEYIYTNRKLPKLSTKRSCCVVWLSREKPVMIRYLIAVIF